jgi:hypothetical protein
LIVAALCGCLRTVIRFARAVLDAVRLAFARDSLGPEAPPPPPAPSGPKRGALRGILGSREPLGTEPEPPPRPERSALRAIFAREVLPLDPEPPARPRAPRIRETLPFDPEPPPRPRAAGLRETLPLDPVPPPAPRRRGRLAALFALEKLDDSP